MPAYDGTFPNWKQVVPKQTSQSFTVSQSDIKRILKSLQKSTAMKHGELGTSIIFSGITEQSSQITIATDNKEFVDEWGKLEIKTDAIIHHIESEAICLNGTFLKDALANMTGDATFAFTSELQPIMLTDSDNKKAFVIIMPMKRSAACKEEPAKDK
jgi:DNA polymerase III sliding clamp (beta) subunit (PCNA family)